jgi:hypothetical protein
MIDQYRLDLQLNNGKTEYVMCAANWVDDKIEHIFQPFNIPTGIVYCGWRHPYIFQQYRERFPQEIFGKYETQGFLTTKNRFLTRKEALELVKENGQLTKPLIGDVLTSEDLW